MHEHKNNDEFKPMTLGITLSTTETVKKKDNLKSRYSCVQLFFWFYVQSVSFHHVKTKQKHKIRAIKSTNNKRASCDF